MRTGVASVDERDGAPSAHAEGDAASSSKLVILQEQGSDVASRKNALAALAYVGQRLRPRGRAARRRVAAKEAERERLRRLDLPDGRLIFGEGGDRSADVSEGETVLAKPPTRSDDVERATKRAAAYLGFRTRARRVLVANAAVEKARRPTRQPVPPSTPPGPGSRADAIVAGAGGRDEILPSSARSEALVQQLKDVAKELAASPRETRRDDVAEAVARTVDATRAGDSPRVARLRAAAETNASGAAAANASATPGRQPRAVEGRASDPHPAPAASEDPHQPRTAVARAAAKLEQMRERRRAAEAKNRRAEAAYGGRVDVVLNEAEARAKLAKGLPGGVRPSPAPPREVPVDVSASPEDEAPRIADEAASVARRDDSAAATAGPTPRRVASSDDEVERSKRAKLREAAYAGAGAAARRWRRAAAMAALRESRRRAPSESGYASCASASEAEGTDETASRSGRRRRARDASSDESDGASSEAVSDASLRRRKPRGRAVGAASRGAASRGAASAARSSSSRPDEGAARDPASFASARRKRVAGRSASPSARSAEADRLAREAYGVDPARVHAPVRVSARRRVPRRAAATRGGRAAESASPSASASSSDAVASSDAPWTSSDGGASSASDSDAGRSRRPGRAPLAARAYLAYADVAASGGMFPRRRRFSRERGERSAERSANARLRARRPVEATLDESPGKEAVAARAHERERRALEAARRRRENDARFAEAIDALARERRAREARVRAFAGDVAHSRAADASPPKPFEPPGAFAYAPPPIDVDAGAKDLRAAMAYVGAPVLYARAPGVPVAALDRSPPEKRLGASGDPAPLPRIRASSSDREGALRRRRERANAIASDAASQLERSPLLAATSRAPRSGRGGTSRPFAREYPGPAANDGDDEGTPPAKESRRAGSRRRFEDLAPPTRESPLDLRRRALVAAESRRLADIEAKSRARFADAEARRDAALEQRRRNAASESEDGGAETRAAAAAALGRRGAAFAPLPPIRGDVAAKDERAANAYGRRLASLPPVRTAPLGAGFARGRSVDALGDSPASANAPARSNAAVPSEAASDAAAVDSTLRALIRDVVFADRASRRERAEKRQKRRENVVAARRERVRAQRFHASSERAPSPVAPSSEQWRRELAAEAREEARRRDAEEARPRRVARARRRAAGENRTRVSPRSRRVEVTYTRRGPVGAFASERERVERKLSADDRAWLAYAGATKKDWAREKKDSAARRTRAAALGREASFPSLAYSDNERFDARLEVLEASSAADEALSDGASSVADSAEAYSDDFDAAFEKDAGAARGSLSPGASPRAVRKNPRPPRPPPGPDAFAAAGAALETALEAATREAMEPRDAADVDDALDALVYLVENDPTLVENDLDARRRSRAPSGREGDGSGASPSETVSLEERVARGVASVEARLARERDARAEALARAEEERFVSRMVAAIVEKVCFADNARRAAAAIRERERVAALEAFARALLFELCVDPAVIVVEEPDLQRRLAILKRQNEALRLRLAWEPRLEFTPRAILRATPFSLEEIHIIRNFEPALALRVKKDRTYDPFRNGYDLSWQVDPNVDSDGEERDEPLSAREARSLGARAEKARRNASTYDGKGGAFKWAPPPVRLGHDAADDRAKRVYKVKSARLSSGSRESRRSRRSSAASSRPTSAAIAPAPAPDVGSSQESAEVASARRARRANASRARLARLAERRRVEEEGEEEGEATAAEEEEEGGGGAETCDEGSSAPGTLRFDESTGLFAVEASPEEPEPVSPATEREKARDAARDAARSARRRIDEEAEASGLGSGRSDPGSSDEGGGALSPRSPLQSPLEAGAKPDDAPAAVFVDLPPLEARYTEPPARMRKSLA